MVKGQLTTRTLGSLVQGVPGNIIDTPSHPQKYIIDLIDHRCGILQSRKCICTSKLAQDLEAIEEKREYVTLE